MTDTRGILFIGPPGSGKVARVRQMARGLPPLFGKAAVETAWIFYGARLLDEPANHVPAPFRAPHHTVSEAGLIGSGWKSGLRPGEVSLAHNGCLLLDELPEFRKSCIEAVGRALRAGQASILGREALIPAKPLLICASSNLCPCGWLGSSRPCICKAEEIDLWSARLVEYCEALGITEIVPCRWPEGDLIAQGRANLTRLVGDLK